MSVLSPPPRDELELLIREARARQRRRWLGAIAVVAVLSGAALGVRAIVGGGGPAKHHASGPRPSVALPPRCTASQLRASSTFDGAFTGHSVVGFTLRNVSSETCTLRGRPKLTLVMRSGRRIPAREQRIRNLTQGALPVPVRTVVLRPRGTASFHVVAVDQSGTEGPLPQDVCRWSRRSLITPPGVGRPVPVASGLSTCGLAVTPLFAGHQDRLTIG